MLKKIFLISSFILFQANAVNAQTFNSLKPQSSTDKFDACMTAAGKIGDDELAKCLNDRVKELMLEIKEVYEYTVAKEVFKKWNNGSEMRSGNMRDMFDSWIAYRDKYCSVYTVSMEEYMGTNNYNLADCLHDMTEDHLMRIKKLVSNLATAD